MPDVPPMKHKYKNVFTCSVCHEIKSPVKSSIGIGYTMMGKGQKVCYDCCADRDRDYMHTTGDSKALPLYLSLCTMEIINWPGSLRFKIIDSREGRHNIVGRRLDIWFEGPDGFLWWGWNLGYSDIVHCKRTKSKYNYGR